MNLHVVGKQAIIFLRTIFHSELQEHNSVRGALNKSETSTFLKFVRKRNSLLEFPNRYFIDSQKAMAQKGSRAQW